MADFREISSPDRNQRRSGFRPDPDDERMLDRLNGAVCGLEDDLASRFGVLPARAIVIIGAPRSGTTLLYQTLASRLKVGYVSNLMARFYQAPLTGAWLQSRLISTEMAELQTFSSEHGVTRRVFEPHEFGYFWARHIPFVSDDHQDLDRQRVAQDLGRLELSLGQISGVFDGVVAYKCAIAPFILADLLAHTSAFFVTIVRDKQAVCESILNVRRTRMESEGDWWSIRPAGWQDLLDKLPEDQVAWQYDAVLSALRDGCRLDPERFVEVSYSRLVTDPGAVVGEIASAYSGFSGVSVDFAGRPA